MENLHAALLGRCEFSCSGVPLKSLGVRKAQELLCYLLLFRTRPHHREQLAALLWENASTSQSRDYLRKTLWQLQSALGDKEGGTRLLLVEDEWVEVNPNSALWLDVAQLEATYGAYGHLPGGALAPEEEDALTGVVDLYRGDLLQGWYCDWCLNERERCQHMYVTLLDMLVERCIETGRYARGIDYGSQVLRHDAARERTFRQLMLLHALSGDRTAAIRQFERCAAVLQRELGVPPAAGTLELHQRICRGEAPSALPLS